LEATEAIKAEIRYC